MESRATSATTAPSPPWRNPSSKAGEDGFLVARLDVDHAVGREARLAPGPARTRSWRVDTPQYLSARPRGDARRRRAPAAAPSIAPLPPPATSCRAPSGSPPPGRCRSISRRPKGKRRSAGAQPRTLKAPDALSKLRDTAGRVLGVLMPLGNALGQWYVLHLFSNGPKSEYWPLLRVMLVVARR